MTDQRYLKLKEGLNQLNIEELQRILDYEDEMVCDTYIYDQEHDRW